jgi:hypothetical protein
MSIKILLQILDYPYNKPALVSDQLCLAYYTHVLLPRACNSVVAYGVDRCASTQRTTDITTVIYDNIRDCTALNRIIFFEQK